MNESNEPKVALRFPARLGAPAKEKVVRALLSLALVPLLACSSSHTSDSSKPEGPIPECEEYASRYEACLSAAGTREVAHRRAQATRDAFAAAVRDGSGLAELRKTCAAGLARLSCR